MLFSVVTLVVFSGISDRSPIDRVRRKQNTSLSTRSVYQNKEVIRRIALLPCVTMKIVVTPCCVLMTTQIDRSKSIHVQISIDTSATLRSRPFLLQCGRSFTCSSYGIGGSMSRGREKVRKNVQTRVKFSKMARRIYMHT
jgi:hypothetical protein